MSVHEAPAAEVASEFQDPGTKLEAVDDKASNERQDATTRRIQAAAREAMHKLKREEMQNHQVVQLNQLQTSSIRRHSDHNALKAETAKLLFLWGFVEGESISKRC